uniref:Pre-mRNA-splicing factor 18 n=1 Tax=Auxenochlorella protothecoides TaxID=3075 RepID=A0A1D1ZPT8_AUXPR
MDKLRELLASKKKAAEAEFGGKRYLKRSELEELRLRKLREEEEAERARKAPNDSQEDASPASVPADAAGKDGEATASTSKPRPSSRQDKAAAAGSRTGLQTDTPQLTREEVIRRLRRLKEPATLFGESDEARAERLAEAQRTLTVDDETEGGQQANFNIEFARQQRAAKKARRTGEGGTAVPEEAAAPAGAELDPERQALMASFRAAADSLAATNLPLEDRLARRLRGWCADWEADLEARSEEDQASPAGYQATLRYRETVQYLRPLFARLRNRSLEPEMLAGLKMIVEAMAERNYLHAYKIYMGLAIGNSPWPIGVTQVGLHERSAREKISFKSSMSTAHIMNDEATRKFIQALKRMMTFCQRRYPTDPSRSVDFDGGSSQGRGAMGDGSDKLALLEALSKGESVAPAPAPSVMEGNAVKIPPRWEHQIRAAMKDVAKSETTTLYQD